MKGLFKVRHQFPTATSTSNKPKVHEPPQKEDLQHRIINIKTKHEASERTKQLDSQAKQIKRELEAAAQDRANEYMNLNTQYNIQLDYSVLNTEQDEIKS